MWSSIRAWAPKLAVAAATALLFWQLAVAAGLFLEHDWSAIRFPHPLDYGEGPLLDQAVRLARMENIYRRDLAQPPYTISNYPPLFLLAQVPFVWLFGPAFWYGRMIATLSALAAAVFCGVTLYTLTEDRASALIGGLALLAFPYVLHWSPLNRVDSLALGSSWAGLYAVARWSQRRRGLVAGALLLTAAVYTRQSYALAAPLAAFVWLLREPPRRRALELAAWVAGMGLAAFAVLCLATGGGFYLNTVTANVNPFRWETVERYAREMWEHVPTLLVGGGLLLVLGAWLRPRSWWLAAPYLLGATLSALTVGKSGSSVNYMFEISAALSITVGALVAWSSERRWLRAMLVLFLAFQVSEMTEWTRERYVGRMMWKIERRDEIERMARIVAEANGPVLGDEFMGLVTLAGKDLCFQPFEFKQLQHAGVWDERPFVESIRRGEYPVILLYDPRSWDSGSERWTDAMRSAIAARYAPVGRLAETLVYRPRG